MKKFFILLLTFSSITLYAQTESEPIILASDVWPPFTDEVEHKHIAIDIVGNALQRAGYLADFKIIDFEEVVGGIVEGHYNGSPALWKSEEREKDLIYSESYIQNRMILVGRKGNVMSQSEAGKRKIGAIENYAYGDELKSISTQIIYGKSNQENLEKLLAGELDFILVDALIIQYLLQSQPQEAQKYLDIGKSPVVTKTLHFALDRNYPGAEKIIEDFNKEIQQMIADGSYHDILDLDWIQADVDGDGKLELVLKGNEAGLEAPKGIYQINSGGAQNSGRYYINGKFYNSWEDVPEKSKISIPKTDVPVDPGKGEMRIRLK